MKKLSMAEWEKKYVAGDVQRFDQKYTMFNRPGWAPEINGLVDDWSLNGPPKDKAGFTIEDRALLSASSVGTMLGLFNVDKPNPKAGSESLMQKLAALPKGPFLYQPPEGMKADAGNPREMTEKVKKAARWFGADMVGICKMDKRWAYSHTYAGTPYMGIGDGSKHAPDESVPQEIPDEFQYAIVMCYEMDYDIIQNYTNYISVATVARGYSQMAITNACLSTFIKGMGYKVINCTTNDVALSTPMAIQAGLGDLGRNGLLITPKYGPRVRISKVITDLPLVPDSPIDFGVTEFCKVCEICAEKCPSQSIKYGDRTTQPNNISNVGGVAKWPINAETCRSYWSRRKSDCSVCINVCPYNKPDKAFHRFVRWCTDHVRWGDPLYVLADKWMGYGKPTKPDEFWDEWQPSR
ncbi:MAG: reductive dehalogenase [Deltaproteobacteria bacterium]|nr:reductive dehalogenase [Deltaproteobacteria bacterium]